MQQERRRERGSPLEPEQIAFIRRKRKEERLSITAMAAKCGIATRSVSNALNGNDLDDNTRDAILKGLDVPDLDALRQDHRRRYNIQPERNGFFTGREDTMLALCAALQASQFAAVTQALSGLGGIGKTATAVEYAYRCLDKTHFPNYPHYEVI